MSDLYDDHTNAAVGFFSWLEQEKINLKNVSYITNFALKLFFLGRKI